MTLINRTVLMSDARNFRVDSPINPYYGAPTADAELAEREHQSIKAAFREAGVEVITTSSPIESQDGVYTANWALVREDVAILARLPEVRKAEEAHAEKVLRELGKEIIYAPKGLKFSGQGDALPCGEYLFCGRGYRSDEAAQVFAAETLGYTRVQLETIPQRDANGNAVVNTTSGWADSFFYDIDLAFSILRAPTTERKGLIAYCPEAFTEESQRIIEGFDAVEKIIMTLTEAQESFAANLVSTGETVIMSATAPLLKQAIIDAGLAVITPEVKELAKGGGYIRCTALTLD